MEMGLLAAATMIAREKVKFGSRGYPYDHDLFKVEGFLCKHTALWRRGGGDFISGSLLLKVGVW